MKLLKNTLKPNVEEWDDQGDYPSNAGAGPLPSYKYLAGVEGELVYELTDEEVNDYVADEVMFVENMKEPQGLVYELPNGIDSAEWTSVLKEKDGKHCLELEAKSCEPDSNWSTEMYDPPESDDDYDLPE